MALVWRPEPFPGFVLGTGVNENHWAVQGSGADMDLSKILEPLEPLKHKMNVIHGLFHKRAITHGITRRRPEVCSQARTFRREPSSKRASASQMLSSRIGRRQSMLQITLFE